MCPECEQPLEHREAEWVEPHGERCYQAWWYCRACGWKEETDCYT
jgi:C4-type Zn-finger protein